MFTQSEKLIWLQEFRAVASVDKAVFTESLQLDILDGGQRFESLCRSAAK